MKVIRALLIVLLFYVGIHLLSTLVALLHPRPDPLTFSHLCGVFVGLLLLFVLLTGAFRRLGAKPTPPPLPPHSL